MTEFMNKSYPYIQWAGAVAWLVFMCTIAVKNIRITITRDKEE